MKIRDYDNDYYSSTGSNRNSFFGSNFVKNNIFNNNLNNSEYDVDKSIYNEEFIKKVQRNYVDYYYKNESDLERYNFYNDILNSLNFENRKAENKDIIIIDKLFSLNTDESQNLNLNTTNLNESVNFF